MCNGYFGADDDVAVVFTGKKLRQVSSAGIASLAVCLPNETVATQTVRFMRGVGYRGCVGIGYRYDARDGQYKVLDVNARVSGVFRLFAGTNDMDVVRLCYLDLTGQPLPPTALQPGRKWLLENDFVAAFRGIRDRSLSVRRWLASLVGVREWHWLALDDPARSWRGCAPASAGPKAPDGFTGRGSRPSRRRIFPLDQGAGLTDGTHDPGRSQTSRRSVTSPAAWRTASIVSSGGGRT